jgi:hypothetical protein
MPEIFLEQLMLIQLVMKYFDLAPGIKWLWHEDDSYPSGARVNAWSYVLLIYLYGIVLNYFYLCLSAFHLYEFRLSLYAVFLKINTST